MIKHPPWFFLNRFAARNSFQSYVVFFWQFFCGNALYFCIFRNLRNATGRPVQYSIFASSLQFLWFNESLLFFRRFCVAISCLGDAHFQSATSTFTPYSLLMRGKRRLAIDVHIATCLGFSRPARILRGFWAESTLWFTHFILHYENKLFGQIVFIRLC